MATPSACPGIENLKEFRLGLLPEASAQQVEQHLTGCASCLHRLPALAPDDALARGLRAQCNRPRLNNPLLAKVQQELRARPFPIPDDRRHPTPANFPAPAAIPVSAPGRTSSRRRLMMGGGIAAAVVLIIAIAMIARSPRRPKGNVDKNTKKDPEEILYLRPGARSQERGFAAPTGATIEGVRDRTFPETWVLNPQPVPTLESWSIGTNEVGQVYPTVFDFLADKRQADEVLLIRYPVPPHLPPWMQFDPKTCGLVPAPFGGTGSAVSADARQCARVVPGGVELWEEGGSKPWATLRSPAPENAVFSPDGNTIVTLNRSASGMELWFWDARAGSKLAECRVPDLPLASSVLGWSPDSKTLAVALATQGGVALFRTPWKTCDKMIARPTSVGALAWSPNARHLATAENDNRVRVLDVESGEVVAEIKEPRIANPGIVPVWSIHGKELAFATEDKKVVVWNREQQKVAYTFAGHQRPITAVAFLGDNKTLVSGSKGSVHFWDLEKPRLRGTLLNLSGTGWLAIGPEGNYRCSPGADDAHRFVFKVRDEGNRVRDFFPEDFRKVYGWKNRPEEVQLVPESSGR